MLLVYLLNGPYDLYQFIVLVHDLYEFLLGDGFEGLLLPVELAGVAALVHWIVFTIVFVDVHPLVDLGEHGLELVVVEAPDVHAPALALVPPREAVAQQLLLPLAQIDLEPLEDVDELINEDLVLVIRVCTLF